MQDIIKSIRLALGSPEDKQAFQLTSLGMDLDKLTAQYTSNTNALNAKIADLTAQLSTDTSVKPLWLDATKYVYLPAISMPEGLVTLQDSREIYCSNEELRGIIIANKVHLMKHDDKLMWIWKFVAEWMVYQYDVSDNWQFPVATYHKKQGDCEDGTILFVEMCRIAKVPGNTVFNACGNYHANGQSYGHSYPIALMSDGKWYVFETTIDSIPPLPKAFVGSNYDDTWGLCNWKFKGGDTLMSYTGPATNVGTTGANMEQRNSIMWDLTKKKNDQKMKAIMEDWKQ